MNHPSIPPQEIGNSALLILGALLVLLILAYPHLRKLLEMIRFYAVNKLREIDTEARERTAEIGAVRELEWCNEVLLHWPASKETDNLETSSVIQMPKTCLPKIGEKVSLTARDEIVWRGKLIPVDQRPMRRNDDGNAYLG
jgi:hypothetical protein